MAVSVRLAMDDGWKEGVAARRAKCGEVEERSVEARGNERAAARANTILKDVSSNCEKDQLSVKVEDG